MNKRIIYFFLFIFLFIFFQSVNSATVVDTSANSVFDDFAEVQKALSVWNEAINSRSLDELEKVYDQEVQFYLAKRSASDCIKSKLNWLQKHPTFKQKIKSISIYTIGRTNEKPDIITEFKKECVEGNTIKEYDALLLFRKVGNDWRLLKETDIITEVKRCYNMPLVNLQIGEHNFVREYFKYNKDLKKDTTQLLSYKYSLDIVITSLQVTGKMSIYSGAIRSTSIYKIINGKCLNGILLLTIAPEDGAGNVMENQKQSLRFKVISSQQIMLLNEDMPWLYGKPMIN